MTLTQFVNMLFGKAAIVYVFRYEEDIKAFYNHDDAYELLFTLKSDFKASFYLLPKYANAEVMAFYAVGRDCVGVWINPADEDGGYQ